MELHDIVPNSNMAGYETVAATLKFIASKNGVKKEDISIGKSQKGVNESVKLLIEKGFAAEDKQLLFPTEDGEKAVKQIVEIETVDIAEKLRNLPGDYDVFCEFLNGIAPNLPAGQRGAIPWVIFNSVNPYDCELVEAVLSKYLRTSDQVPQFMGLWATYVNKSAEATAALKAKTAPYIVASKSADQKASGAEPPEKKETLPKPGEERYVVVGNDVRQARQGEVGLPFDRAMDILKQKEESTTNLVMTLMTQLKGTDGKLGQAEVEAIVQRAVAAAPGGDEVDKELEREVKRSLIEQLKHPGRGGGNPEGKGFLSKFEDTLVEKLVGSVLGGGGGGNRQENGTPIYINLGADKEGKAMPLSSDAFDKILGIRTKIRHAEREEEDAQDSRDLRRDARRMGGRLLGVLEKAFTGDGEDEE